ncbi:GTP cyclohydrolase I [Pyronema domesticum]|uniref:GTP cyclohydrolase 1 n=1 Tax=Pyronema omphalodes (strain CBS 100304) TaxID=1076935 RepID=U4LDY8_PYROM|nr:GTP cyclohydrolase I [Pyronema domesticum]CCX09304.1 Similar to GTP cyclohydrolase 1; acc. no. P51601 [Pyronema omphalodes CBS 100304]
MSPPSATAPGTSRSSAAPNTADSFPSASPFLHHPNAASFSPSNPANTKSTRTHGTSASADIVSFPGNGPIRSNPVHDSTNTTIAAPRPTKPAPGDLFAAVRGTDPLHPKPAAPGRSMALTPAGSRAGSRPSTPYTMNPPVDLDGLSWPSIGTRARLEASPEEQTERVEKMSGAIRTLLECLGEDPDREGLQDTPLRYAKAMLYFTKGYEENLKTIINEAVFEEDHDEMVIVKDIEIFSLCEHHLVPFSGRMHIGYIPNRKVLGLSKFARIAEMFARRLQLQERLTKQVAMAIEEILQPQGVAVVMESAHLCMVMRGVGKTTATTTTSSMLGAFRKSTRTREEFMMLVRNSGGRSGGIGFT